MTHDPAVADLIENLTVYAPRQLHIKAKDGKIVPFNLNRAQLYAHECLEKQKKETGKVRAIIVKGRQQGMSTYIGARYFHKTVTRPGTLTFIFAHDSFGSTSLFNMVKTYYDRATDPRWLPSRGASNAKELLFPGLLSGYKVGTAGTGEGLGRGATFQCVHWSEVAYSPNCDDHAAGLMQTVPDLPDTEIILESTANGQNNYFHRAVQNALSGVGDFQLIFIPWYWQAEYTRQLPDDFTLAPEEGELLSLYEKDGLTREHLMWRRAKIKGDFSGDENLFKKEYPFNVQEAFEVSDDRAFIKAKYVIKARATPQVPYQKQPPLIMGIDPARLGGDKFRIVFRAGRNVAQTTLIPPMEVIPAGQRVIELIKRHKPDRVNIDTGSFGVYILEACVAAGFGKIVKGVAFGSRDVMYPERYYNKRAEMYGLALEWLRDEPVSIRFANKKDEDQLQAELTSVQIKRYGVNNDLLLESKDEMQARGIPSPDLADAFVLTFATSVTDDKNNMVPAMSAPILTDTNWNPF